MVKKIVALSVVAAAIFVGVTAQKRQVMLDRVVAVVGGSSILHSEVVSTAEDLTQRRREAGYTSDSDPFAEAAALPEAGSDLPFGEATDDDPFANM
jgi:peptidyl-prolyl cis-trans isomerase SurA